MSAVCDTPVRGKMLRATKLDPCGRPVRDTSGWPVHVVTKGFISVEYAPEFDDGDEIEQKDANGDPCVYIPARRRVKFYNVTVTACKVDPELYTMVTGMPVVLDEHGVATGMRVTSRINLSTAVALELWSGTAARKCTPGSPRPRFGYFLLPQVIDGHVTDFTIENGASNFTLTGKAVEGEGWGTGPFDVYLRTSGVAPLMDPMTDADLLHLDWTTLPPPAPTCGISPRPPDGTVTRGAGDASSRTAQYTATFVPADAQPHTYTVDWGDGAVSPGPATAATVSHSYAADGTFLITVTDTTTGAQRFTSVVVPLAG